MTPQVRAAGPDDAQALLALMRELARFEGCDEQFKVTAADLLARGLEPKGTPEFVAFVVARLATLPVVQAAEGAASFQLQLTYFRCMPGAECVSRRASNCLLETRSSRRFGADDCIHPLHFDTSGVIGS